MGLCASAAKLRSGGPILPLGMTAMSYLGTPPPRTVIGDRSQADRLGRNCQVPSASFVHGAGRRTIPSGTMPSRTRRQRAIRSLRAKATIIVLRVPRAFSVRARNHCAKELSFWNMRNRQASWITPRRTRKSAGSDHLPQPAAAAQRRREGAEGRAAQDDRGGSDSIDISFRRGMTPLLRPGHFANRTGCCAAPDSGNMEYLRATAHPNKKANGSRSCSRGKRVPALQ